MNIGPVQGSVLSGIRDSLRDPLITEFNKVARNFREGRWEPAELNGGKLCEIVYTILKGHVDGAFPSRPSKPKNMVEACRQLEQATGFPRSIRIQIPRILVALYEVRNNRNVGHVGADVDPNHMDALLVLEMSKWIMAELVRIFHNISTEEATAAVESLVERTIPILWRVNGTTRVLAIGLSARDKALAVLYGSAEALSATEVVRAIEYTNPARFRSTVLRAAHKEGLLHFDRKHDQITLSPLGIRYVEEHIALTV